MSPLTEPTRIVLRNGWQPMDPDAAAYITAVETADGQALEEPVKIAIDNFVLGCKADGIWDAIKASCILAGARTLDGALVPLVGTAPTNFNFVAGDYNRKTGLVGDGSTKYLDSNRNNNADPQDSQHLAVYCSESATADGALIGVGTGALNGASVIIYGLTLSQIFIRSRHVLGQSISRPQPLTGLVGLSRSVSGGYIARAYGSNSTQTQISQAPLNASIFVFARNDTVTPVNSPSDARINFYSIGQSLDLALLDARVTDLINKFAEVIP